MKILITIFLISSLLLGSLNAQSTAVRIKDLGNLIEFRDNQLVGYGIVVGLRGSGDSRVSGLTSNALRNLLSKMGVAIGGLSLTARNAASVLVTADLPPFTKKGQRISVTVSAMGDATSLSGGTLIMTPMMGPDMSTYAIAQGIVVVDGQTEQSSTSQFYKNQATVGSVVKGAIVEAEVPVTFVDQHNITLVLDKPNFYTASKVMKAIQLAGYEGAKAVDANTIKIPLSDLNSADLITTISQIEDIEITPDLSAKIVINSKTGTIIIGEKVRLFPVAITHGNMSIRIRDDVGGLFGEQVEPIEITEQQTPLVFLQPEDTLSSLVNSLNLLGFSPKDLISILTALKESGALVGELKII